MAKNIKKVSITTMDKVVKEHFPQSATVEWCGNEVNIKRTLSVSEMLAFVDDVVSSCYNDGEYLPEVKAYLIRRNVLTRYANFNLPDDLEHSYELVYATDAFEQVMANINDEQMDSILCAIDEKIDYLCNSNIAAVEKQAQDAVSALEDILGKAEEVFGNINPEDIIKIVGAVSEGRIDEEKLVKAYMDNKYDSQDEAEAE